MTDRLKALLEDDHDSLGAVLAELEQDLARSNFSRAFKLLDTFWARLAVHIRAENLHLFPAIASSPMLGEDGLTTEQEAKALISYLRADHDFFMKELAGAIAVMRELTRGKESHPEKVDKVRRCVAVVKERLDEHNLLEEQQVYVWPSLLFDKDTLNELCKHLQHELENLPPRFRKS